MSVPARSLEEIWVQAAMAAVAMEEVGMDHAGEFADYLLAQVKERRDIGWDEHAKERLEHFKAAKVEHALINSSDRVYFSEEDEEADEYARHDVVHVPLTPMDVQLEKFKGTASEELVKALQNTLLRDRDQ